MTDSTFKILLTTDNHLGYAERDPRRGDDSFTTFEEILRAARTEHDVDLMLLGGDLFHENKPSLGCLVRACSLFRKYVYGNKEIAFSLLSDPATNFPTHALPMANFQDPNINVALPVFGIHGNHDDPVGGTSSLDLLATNGYLNYFGHVTSLEDIVVEPVLLRKGGTFLALYGLGNVRDERLHRCFRLKKVQFIYPKAVPGRKWFNILIVHQNRGVRGAASKNGILESMLAGFGMDVVIWGNEHEQMMVPQPSDGFDVVQPGSTVLTSLSAQECNPKQYGVLEVRGTSYRLTPYPLRSVRPVVRRTVELRADVPDGRTLDAVETFLHGVMRDMVREAEEQVARIPDDVITFHPNLKYPLIRLAVDFSDVTSAPYPQPNFNRFGQQYMDVVANPGEVLRPVKPKPERRVPGTVLGPGGVGTNGLVVAVPAAPQLNTLDIRVKVAEVFNSNAKHACTLLSESELSAAVYAFAEKGERDAIDERLMELLHTSQKSVWRRLESGASEGILNPSKVVEEVASHKRQVNERYARAAQLEDVQHQQQQRGRRGKAGEDGASDGEGGEDEEEGSGGVQGSRRGYGDSINTGIDHPHTRRTMDAFERVRVAPPTAASSREGLSSVAGLGEQGGYDDFGAHTNVSALVQRAIDHDQTLLRGGRAAAGAAAEGGGDADGQASRRRATRQGVAEEEEEDDELPGDGLDRSLLDTVIAQAVQQQTGQAKRPRSGGPTSPVPRGLEGDDEGGPYGGGSGAARRHNIDGDDGDVNEEEDGVVRVEDGLADEGSYGGARGRGRGPAKKPRTAAGTRSNGGGGGGSGAASRRRGGGGGGADSTARRNAGGAAASSGAGGPTLSLTPHHGAAASRAYASNAQASRAGPGAGAASGAMLDLLSKWTNAPSQQ